MMILDRITGEKLSLTQLPEELIAGRYILLEPAKVNRHTMLPKGAYIMSDGTDKLELNQHSFSVEEPQVNKTTQDRSYWARQAIIQIAGEFHISAFENLKELPSPLIPKDLVNTSYHDALLDLLWIVIRKGHLHIISSRPRIDMRYDDMLLPVSRVKRVASNAGQHLAAHSECWQKRTFTGIMPKKILGLVSEDEYNLYENQVFARLLDGLQKYLSKKLYNLLRLEENLARLKKIEGSDRLFHKLIESICELWGKAHPGTENGALHLLVEEQRKTTEDYLRTVKGLKQRGLYKLVPRSAQVARQIRVTNILAHDQHYRHLVGLWQALADAMASDNLSAAEVLQNNIGLQEAYVGYCQLVIIRSLAAMKFKLTKERKHELLFNNGQINLSLILVDGGWVVSSELATLDLHFIPIAAWHTSGLRTVYTQNNIRIPCIPVKAEQLSPAEWLTTQKNEPFHMSPEDFYLEEKMVVLLQTWLWSGAMLTYGKVISKLTGHFINYIEGQRAFTSLVDGNSMKIIAPVPDKDAEEFFAQLSTSGLSKNRQDEINTIVKNLTFMSTCQNCGASSTFAPWDKDCFQCHCSSCGMTWGIYHTKSHRVGKFISSKECVPGFLNNGRWNYSFDLSSFSELPEK